MRASRHARGGQGLKAMILAAGRGERMRPLTDSVPKPLLQVNGKHLIEYHLEALAGAGVSEVVINLCWLGEQIMDFVGDGARWGMRVQYSPEGPQALETGGGIFRALELLGDKPFWLVNGDIYCEYGFPAIELEGDDLAHLLLVANPPHNADGDFVLSDGRLHAHGNSRLTYSGIAVLHPELFQGCSDLRFPLAPLLVSAIQAARVAGSEFTGIWTDVGTPQRLEELSR